MAIEVHKPDDKDNPRGSARGLVLPFAVPPRQRQDVEPYLTNEERREIREMLAYYRATRPKLEGLFHGCPTARRLLEDG